MTRRDARRGQLAAAHHGRAPSAADWVVNAAGPRCRPPQPAIRPRRVHHRARRGQLIVFDKLARALVLLHRAAGPHRTDEGRPGGADGLRQRAVGPRRPRTSQDRGDTATTAAGIDGLLDAGRRILPDLVDEEVTATYAGVRAATEHRGLPDHDPRSRALRLRRGIRSTGLTASLAIAEHVVEEMGAGGLSLVEAEHEPAIPHMPELAERATQALRGRPIGRGSIRPTGTSCASASGSPRARCVMHSPLRCPPATSVVCAGAPGRPTGAVRASSVAPPSRPSSAQR